MTRHPAAAVVKVVEQAAEMVQAMPGKKVGKVARQVRPEKVVA
jgi:hypothetical protein